MTPHNVRKAQNAKAYKKYRESLTEEQRTRVRAQKAAYMRARRISQPDVERETQRIYKAKNRDKVRMWDKKSRYKKRGAEMPTRPTPHLCECCGRPQLSKSKTVLCADHCHLSGLFRGWLCDPCNRGLGLLQDRPELAVDYLKRVNYARV